MKTLKVSLVFGSMVLTLIETTQSLQFDNLIFVQLFHNGQTGSDAKFGTTLISTACVNVVAMIITQLRIEHDALQSQEVVNAGFLSKIKSLCGRKTESGNSVTSTGYSMKINRIMVGLAVLLVILVLIHMLNGKKWIRALFATLAHVLLPLLFIYNHPKMKDLAKKLIQSKIEKISLR